eukprot:TRINITY_DN66359_c0_g1_i1.p1 TRINITY_DN66359_c0_g1~~TRINITY_DN66359_c0_g1_i1.p1  ORF type:complete len:355 (-),score=61.25 TRINITY_DN66359_c0_g1_i1:17-1048(-)
MTFFRSRMLRCRKALSWSPKDAKFMETCLGAMTDEGVPRINDVVEKFAYAMNEHESVDLDSRDPILTDTVRCFMAHPWRAAVVQKRDKAGNMVASFFTEPCDMGQKLSLFSSQDNFDRLRKEHALKGTILTAEARSFCQVVMRDLPMMSVNVFRQRNLPEVHAVRTLALDPAPTIVTLGGTASSRKSNLELSDAAFPLLESFCKSWVAAGAALQASALIEEKAPSAVALDLWDTILRQSTLAAVMTSGAVFSSEAGLLLFCYPGDASKVLAFHQQQKTPGLEEGKVLPVEPAQLIDLLKWQAGRQGNTLIVTAVLEDGASPQCHGFSITPAVFRSTEPMLAEM